MSEFTVMGEKITIPSQIMNYYLILQKYQGITNEIQNNFKAEYEQRIHDIYSFVNNFMSIQKNALIPAIDFVVDFIKENDISIENEIQIANIELKYNKLRDGSYSNSSILQDIINLETDVVSILQQREKGVVVSSSCLSQLQEKLNAIENKINSQNENTVCEINCDLISVDYDSMKISTEYITYLNIFLKNSKLNEMYNEIYKQYQLINGKENGFSNSASNFAKEILNGNKELLNKNLEKSSNLLDSEGIEMGLVGLGGAAVVGVLGLAAAGTAAAVAGVSKVGISAADESKLKSIYKKIDFSKIISALDKDLNSIFNEAIRILSNYGIVVKDIDLIQQNAVEKLSNLKASTQIDDDMHRQVIDILSIYPSYKECYEFFIDKFADNNGEISLMAISFGIDLSQYIDNKIKSYWKSISLNYHEITKNNVLDIENKINEFTKKHNVDTSESIIKDIFEYKIVLAKKIICDINVDSPEDEVLVVKNKLYVCCSEINLQVPNVVTDQLEQTLKQIDINIRTVEGYEFESRESALIAKKYALQFKDFVKEYWSNIIIKKNSRF